MSVPAVTLPFVPQRFDLNDETTDTMVVLHNGEPLSATRALRIIDVRSMPFAGVYLDQARQYDADVWSKGTLVARVPPQDAVVDEVFEAIETKGQTIKFNEYPTPAELHAAQDGYKIRIDSLRAELREHPGEVAHHRWQNLMRTLAVHRGNGRELAELLGHVGSSTEIGIEMFQNTRPPHVRELVQAQVDQRLHNYVASTSSLIDHSRRLMAKYAGTTLLAEYDNRRSTISTSPEAVFIRDLRNFTQHRELPFIGHTVSMNPSKGTSFATTKFELSTAILAEWGGWTAPAKQLLGSAGATVVLREVMQRHLDLVEDLYAWLFAQAQTYHRFEYTLADDLRGEFNWSLSGGQEGTPRRFGQRFDYLRPS